MITDQNFYFPNLLNYNVTVYQSQISITIRKPKAFFPKHDPLKFKWFKQEQCSPFLSMVFKNSL